MKILLIFPLFFSLISHANDKILKICLTGSTEKTIPNYGEAFWNGAVLAKEELRDAIQKKIELELHYYDVTPLAALKGLQVMRKANCDAIIGFSTGNDLIAVEDDLSKNPLLALSIYGDPLDRFQNTTFLRTIQPNAESLLSHLFKELPHKIHSKSRVLVVTASDRSEMIEYKKSSEKILSKYTKSVTHLSVMEQTHDISEFLKLYKDKKKWDFVVLFTRSLIAAKITDEITRNAPTHKPVLIGTKYFGSSELPAFLNFLKNKDIEAYFARQNCSCDDSKEFLAFKERYLARFKKKPMLISADTYDAVRFLAQAAGILNQFTPTSVLDFFNRDNSFFRGIGTMVVGPRLKVKAEKRYLIKVTKNGYERVK